MLYEFAVEPAAIADWERCRGIFDYLGVSHARLLAEFPKRRKWLKLVFKACEARGLKGTREWTRIEEKVRGKKQLFLPTGRDYDEAVEWRANALAEHARLRFHAVLLDQEPDDDSDDALIVAGEQSAHPRWKVPREERIARNPADLANHVRPLLRMSSEILFVDPFFDPDKGNKKSLPMLEACLAAATASGRSFQRVEYHLLFDKLEHPFEYFRGRCEARLPGILPRGLELRLVRWSERDRGDEFHDRFILTNRGGYNLGSGVDVAAPGKKQKVSLLDDAVFAEIWSFFQDGASTYEFVDELRISG